MHPAVESLFEGATRRYARVGRVAWHTARGKLRHDPVYFTLLKRGMLPARGRLYDLGCGQGLLMALLLAARDEYRAGRWPAGWAMPPLDLELHGIELRADRVRTARVAVGEHASVEVQDIRAVELAPCQAIVLLDVLLYLCPAAQRRVLEKAGRSLAAQGVLLLRETDAGRGAAFQFTRMAERFWQATRGHWGTLHYRSDGQWARLLDEMGFDVTSERADEGTPFANTLHIGRRRSACIR